MENNFRLTDSQLKTLAAHILDQDRQMQFPASGYFKFISSFRFFDLQSDIDFSLFKQSFFNIP
ncbi:hypothetical protein SDC9_195643 [bioreactor metagenome]|uniref:Uncharacterized protein n=1 Tax=bioreactor metagenome TaxID=1076179 RepID=A0A645IC53_9ZZZZ